MNSSKNSLRKSIFPEQEIKIINLCLNSSEDGTLYTRIERIEEKKEKCFKDSLVNDIISKKIKEQKENISNTLRKKAFYQNTANEKILEEANDFDKYFKNNLSSISPLKESDSEIQSE